MPEADGWLVGTLECLVAAKGYALQALPAEPGRITDEIAGDIDRLNGMISLVHVKILERMERAK